MEDMNDVKKEVISMDLNKTIEEFENKVMGIAEDINIIYKLMGVTLILEIFILVFFLLEMQGV